MTKQKQPTYHTIITDIKENKGLKTIFSANTIIPLPQFQEYKDTIDYFLQLRQTLDKQNQSTLIASTNQLTLLPAKSLGLDTCFLNNGLNDIIEFNPTCEVSTMKIKQKK